MSPTGLRERNVVIPLDQVRALKARWARELALKSSSRLSRFHEPDIEIGIAWTGVLGGLIGGILWGPMGAAVGYGIGQTIRVHPRVLSGPTLVGGPSGRRTGGA